MVISISRRHGRLVLAAATLMMSGLTGCAFPHGARQGDPLLGNFHRPIVRTPNPERGGIGPDSPAYDAGARIGVPAPDVPSTVENSSGFMTLPSISNTNIMSGAKMPFMLNDAPLARAGAGPAGARLATNHATPLSLPPTQALAAAPSAATQRPRDATTQITSASAFIPAATPAPVRTANYELLHEPNRIHTVDEGQNILQAIGAKNMRAEQLGNGDWSFTCVIGTRPYQGRGQEPVEAIRQVAHQIRTEK